MFMKLKQILYTKKFWTLVSSLIAVLATYFLTSCTVSYRTSQRFVKYEGPDSSSYLMIFDQKGSSKSSKYAR